MANKTVEYLMSRNKLLCVFVSLLLYFENNETVVEIARHKNHIFLCIYSYVSYKWKIPTSQTEMKPIFICETMS